MKWTQNGFCLERPELASAVTQCTFQYIRMIILPKARESRFSWHEERQGATVKGLLLSILPTAGCSDTERLFSLPDTAGQAPHTTGFVCDDLVSGLPLLGLARLLGLGFQAQVICLVLLCNLVDRFP